MILSTILQVNFGELRKAEVRAEGHAAGEREIGATLGMYGGYSSPTNSSKGTPYALASLVTVGM